MKDVLELIVKSLVNNCNSINIEETVEKKEHSFKVSVSKEDMGKIIGKQGKIARSIRTIMKSIAGREGKYVNVEFVEE